MNGSPLMDKIDPLKDLWPTLSYYLPKKTLKRNIHFDI